MTETKSTKQAPRSEVAARLDARLREVFHCRLVRREGAIVGAWRVVSAHRRTNAANAVGTAPDLDVRVHGLVRTPDDRVVGIDHVLRLDGDMRGNVLKAIEAAIQAPHGSRARQHATTSFAKVARAAASLVNLDGISDGKPPIDAYARSMIETLRDLALPRATEDDLRMAALERKSIAIKRMTSVIDVFDPDAVSLLLDVRGHDLDIVESWGGLALTFDETAPLLPAIDALPGRVRTLSYIWKVDPEALRGAAPGCDWASFVDDWVVEREIVPAGLAHILPDAEAAMAGMEPAVLASALGQVQGRRDATLDGGDAVWLASALPGDAIPVTTEGWAALIALAPVILETQHWRQEPGELQALDLSDGLVAAASQLARRCPAIQVEQAFALSRHMADTFARQIVIPALALDMRTDPDLSPEAMRGWQDAAHSMLFSGRSVPNLLVDAQQWARTSQTLKASMKGISGNLCRNRTWAPGLPVLHFGHRLVEIPESWNDLAALLSEGGEGLGIDIKGEAHACLMGTRRVVVLRHDDDPVTPTAASAALLSLGDGKVAVLSHIGRDGAPPSPDCVATMAAYVSAMASDVDLDVLAPAGREVDTLAEYPVGDRSVWSQAYAAWRNIIPNGMKKLPLETIALMARRHVLEASPRWQPVNPGDALQAQIGERLKAQAQARQAADKAHTDALLARTVVEARNVPGSMAATNGDWRPRPSRIGLLSRHGGSVTPPPKAPAPRRVDPIAEADAAWAVSPSAPGM